MIKASDYIKTGFSADDAAKLDTVVKRFVQNDDKVIVDFENITIFTTLFFNNVFSKYILKIGPDAYSQKFELKNLSELGKTTYQHSFNNAVNYYNLSAEKQKQQEIILNNPVE
nr:MAG TPA: protein of unknown function DUF4325 [Caudoviricetes sp.]